MELLYKLYRRLGLTRVTFSCAELSGLWSEIVVQLLIARSKYQYHKRNLALMLDTPCGSSLQWLSGSRPLKGAALHAPRDEA